MKGKQRLTCYFLLPLVATVALAELAAASPVYKWEDDKGVVHYASSPKSKAAKPAELAPIMRGEMKLAQAKITSCDKHGGIDCRAGADSDGSVVCSDGFKGATARYRFSCSTPKLDLADISTPGADGAFSVFVRNSRSVIAKGPTVSVKLGDGKELSLTGPAEVEPYGMAEFQWKSDANAPGTVLALNDKPDAGQITISCANCP
jgi:hypothetical protein